MYGSSLSLIDMDESISLMDKGVEPYLRVFIPLLINKCEESLLPELIAAFGESGLLKFLDIFAGTTFKVPSRKIISDMVRDSKIYAAMNGNKVDVEAVAKALDISKATLLSHFDSVKALLAEIGIDGRRS